MVSQSWHLGHILIEKGWITWEQLEEALQVQKERRGQSKDLVMEKPPTLFLGEILVKNGALTWDALDSAVRIQKDTQRMLGEILIGRGFISEHELYKALAEQAQCAFVNFEKINITPEVLSLVSYSVAKDLNIIPLVKQGKTVLVAVSDTKKLEIEVELKKRMPDYVIHYAMAAPTDIQAAIEKHYQNKSA